jgi:predicted signal transduction protein with EAL and GGDEF domain
VGRCWLNLIDSLKIVQAVAGLASGLNITMAEGVETEQQLEIIRAAGCTEMLGYLFSPPRQAAEILRLILPRAERRKYRGQKASALNTAKRRIKQRSIE